MNTNELGILRLAVAVGVNVYASRYVARIIGIKPDIGGALAVGAMLYQSNALNRLQEGRAEPNLLDQAAAILTAPGSLAVNALAQSSEREMIDGNGGPL
jgi:hypothetical protein